MYYEHSGKTKRIQKLLKIIKIKVFSGLTLKKMFFLPEKGKTKEDKLWKTLKPLSGKFPCTYITNDREYKKRI